MDWIFGILLFLHVFGAIVAFGPTYAFPLIAGMAANERPHMNFALRAQRRISHTLVTPLPLLQLVTGLLLVWKLGFDYLTHVWLLTSIVLYFIALAISFVILYPALRVLIPATSAPPPAPPEGAPAPGGPPPEVAAAARRARIGGMVNSVLVGVIVLLMVLGANGIVP